MQITDQINVLDNESIKAIVTHKLTDKLTDAFTDTGTEPTTDHLGPKLKTRSNTRSDLSPTPITEPARLALGIKQHFETIYTTEYHVSDYPSLEGYLERNLFFVTAHFDLRNVQPSRTQRPTQLAEFEKLHFQISRKMLGNKINRAHKRSQQPLTYAFTDFEGSRYGSSAGRLMPHVHALMLVRPHLLESFRVATFEPRLRSFTPSLREVSIDPFSTQKGTVQNLISYCMKGWAQTRRDNADRDDLWALLPA